MPQREKAMTTAKGQRARSDGLLRPLLALLFFDSNLSSLKDYARTVHASEYLMNKKTEKEMLLVYIKKSLSKNENKGSLRMYM